MADVVEHEESNKMSARNISMVFAPNMTKMYDPLTALMHALQVTNLLNALITRRIRERGVSPRSFNRKKHKKDECESDDDGELHPYSPISEDKYESESESEPESESLSDIEYCFSRQVEEHGGAKDGFRQQLERIVCRDLASPITTLHAELGVSFSGSRIGSSSASTSDDEGSIRSSSNYYVNK